jgi:VWFA-related protein
MEFSDRPRLRQDWTTDRRLIRRAVSDVNGAGGTAMYDAIAEALPVAAGGQHRKKALLVISDGNDRDSTISVSELSQAIRESEVLVYALGVDGAAPTSSTPSGRQPPTIVTPPPTKPPIPAPFPRPPGTGSRRPLGLPQIFQFPASGNERVNARALRQITDDSGGRTEIIRTFRDLDGATARIADELSRQYSLGFVIAERDGRWHTLRVEVRNRDLTVRARRGYQS